MMMKLQSSFEVYELGANVFSIIFISGSLVDTTSIQNLENKFN